MSYKKIISDQYSDIFQIENLKICTNEYGLYEYLSLNLNDYYEVRRIEKFKETYTIYCICSEIDDGLKMKFEEATVIKHTSPSNHENFIKKYFKESNVEYYLDEKSSFVVITELDTNQLIILSSKKNFFKNCKSVIRDQILYGYEQIKPALLLHGAGVTNQEEGIVIIGNKKAGKTTTLINFLRNNFDFCGNDLSFVIEENNILKFKGAPESIRIGVGTLSKCSELINLVEDTSLFDMSEEELFNSETKFEIEWEELADVFNRKVQSGWSRLDYILCPKLDVLKGEFCIQLLNTDEKELLLNENIISKDTKNKSFWLNSIRNLSNIVDNNKIDKLNERIKNIPFIEFKYSGKFEEIKQLIHFINNLNE